MTDDSLALMWFSSGVGRGRRLLQAAGENGEIEVPRAIHTVQVETRGRVKRAQFVIPSPAVKDHRSASTHGHVALHGIDQDVAQPLSLKARLNLELVKEPERLMVMA